jgi:hypothetical protein
VIRWFFAGLFISLAFVAIAWGTGAFDSAKASSCTHGESSVIAYVDKDGKIHQTTPVVTGCVNP